MKAKNFCYTSSPIVGPRSKVRSVKRQPVKFNHNFCMFTKYSAEQMMKGATHSHLGQALRGQGAPRDPKDRLGFQVDPEWWF